MSLERKKVQVKESISNLETQKALALSQNNQKLAKLIQSVIDRLNKK